ncbi:NAD(P)/FAD-dependent oxidoreductase [Beijerinckia mobilis]|uniref:NAD(P)/FAD-dependent oxidoreductase n=1 Tax=Beijerinckia mobilis TaxID=231434 RepID=UPI000B1761EB|nr:TIGR03862 family flavoprotein [Beijerinckia mobilis]
MTPRDATLKEIAVVGGGPAGLFAAEIIAQAFGVSARVTIYERMASVGRKFLLAGRGGLNLTHSEAFDLFLSRYGSAAPRLDAALRAFPPQALRQWCESLGEETFVGSSGRIFPKSFKTSPLLRAWLARLREQGVRFALRHEWRGFDGTKALVFDTPDGIQRIEADAVVLALGGASWPRLGSDGSWKALVEQGGVEVAPLLPANSGFTLAWSEHFLRSREGAPLKNLRLSCRDLSGAVHSSPGELTVTHQGLEGGGLYALGRFLRENLLANGEAWLRLDLCPDLDREEVERRIAARAVKQSLSTFLRKSLHLAPPAIGLINEASLQMGEKSATLAPAELAERIKDLPLRLTGMASIADAISTAGGIAFDEVDAFFMLRKLPGLFVAGEMLDWEAPTGGYLLQACFATGKRAGEGVVQWLGREGHGQ